MQEEKKTFYLRVWNGNLEAISISFMLVCLCNDWSTGEKKASKSRNDYTYWNMRSKMTATKPRPLLHLLAIK